MKIGIVTLTEGYNYGCKLQNYALLTVLSQLFPEDNVVTVNNDTCCGTTRYTTTKKYIKLFFKNPTYYFNDKKKLKVFKDFNKKYLSITDDVLTDSNIDDVFHDIDCWVCGSDQIWNPNYVPNININTAFNAKKNSVKISYAASIGVDSIPSNRVEEYKMCMQTMNAISVRENNAADLIRDLSGKPVNVVVDPTLLLTAEDWCKFEIAPENIPTKYVLTYFLKGCSAELKKKIYKYAADSELTVIDLNDYQQPEWFSCSPNEFIYLIHHSDMFFTDSFHGTVFSIVFHKKILVFDRNSSDEIQKQNSRIKTLLKLTGLNSCYVGNEKQFDISEVSFENVDYVIEEARKESIDFLYSSLKKKERINPTNEACVGCGVCAEGCPVNAIQLQKDRFGFNYPIVNTNKCISCGKCINNCMYSIDVEANTLDEKEAFIVENSDEKIRMKSSSGGVYPAVARKILSRGGAVYSPIFNNNFKLRHRRIENECDLTKSFGSKYIQSEAIAAFDDCKNILEEGREVLFTGTPCQIKALKIYLQKDYSNLYTQDLICHGCSSPNILNNYIKQVEAARGAKVNKFEFRNKKFGWNNFSINIIFNDDTCQTELAKKNHYFLLFLRNYSLRESCYKCICRKSKRESDITLGDFWGIDECDDKGTSLVITNSQKGRKLIESVSEDFNRFEKCDIENAIAKNTAYDKDINYPDKIREFLKDDISDVEKLYIKYIKESLMKKILKRIK